MTREGMKESKEIICVEGFFFFFLICLLVRVDRDGGVVVI